MKKIDWIILFFICAISVFALRSLFSTQYFTSHDGIHQVARLFYFDQSLRDGQFPPRFAGGLLHGLGYPLFSFSYHMPWFIAEAFLVSGFSIFDSIKLTFLAGFILSGITMYFYQRTLFGRLPATVASILYLFAPYRFLNIFVRGAIGDATAFIFPPILFLALHKLTYQKKKNWRWITIGAFALTGLLLSHAMIFFFFAFCFAFASLFYVFRAENKKAYIKSIFSLVALGIGLSGYYLIPSFIERNITNFQAVMKPIFLGSSFLTIRDLLYTPWGYGLLDASVGRMSFQIGIAQWAVVGGSLCIFAIHIIRKFFSRRKQIDSNVFLFWFPVFVISIIIMLPVSVGFWKLVTPYILIDYTWRILALTVFAIAVLSGYFIKNVKFPWFFAGVLILLAFYANRNHTRINESLNWPLDLYLRSEFTTNTYDEYIPKWVWPTYAKGFHPVAEFSNGSAQIQVLKNASNRKHLAVNVGETGSMTLNAIYYPGWQLLVDGSDLHILPNKIGMMEFTLEPGSHDVKAEFKETPLRKLSNIVTGASLLVVLYGFWRAKRHEK